MNRNIHYSLIVWGNSMALREPNDYDLTVKDGSHYTIDPDKERPRTGTATVPKSKRPIIEASGRQYAPCEGPSRILPDDLPPAFEHVIAVEMMLRKQDQLRAYAVHVYVKRGRKSLFRNWRDLDRMLAGLPSIEANESEIAKAISEHRMAKDAERKRPISAN